MSDPTLDEKSIFLRAIEISSSVERSSYVAAACRDDVRLLGEVKALLEAHGRPSGLLDAADLHCVEECPGSTIGPFKLLEVIGEGGMGTVYMAEQVDPVRRRVALKLIKLGMDTRQVVARFEAERQALAMMDHPNIAKVHDAGMTPSGRPYFAMELVRGLPITEYCDQHQLSIAERLELFVLVCRAVQHAHQKGVIHRDLKPSNVLVTVIDGAGVPKVIDFGVAKATGGALTEKTLFTGFHQFVGTPLYTSPEQAELASTDVDTRSDIYSLGVLLYELLTGTTPFDPETLRRAAFDEMRRMIREDEPPKPSTRLSSLGEELSTVSASRKADPRRLGPSMKGELDWVVMKALEKDRRRRYETANDFAADVMRYLADRPVEAFPPSNWYRFSKFARRNRVALTTAGLLFAITVFAVAAGTALVWREKEQTRRALLQSRAHARKADERLVLARRAVDEMYTEVAQKWLSLEGGLTPLQREFLEKALAFYDGFAREKADDPRAQAGAARAAARVGEIRGQLGLTAEALESYRRALDAFRLLAAQFPDEAEYRRDLARCLQDIGRIDESVGRFRDAVPAYRESLALRERLTESTGLPGDRADMAASLGSLVRPLQFVGQVSEGERAGLRAIEQLTRLTDELPKETRYKSLLSGAETSLGNLYLASNERKAEAEGRYKRALELCEQLAAANPADPAAREGLASSYLNLGNHYRHTHREQEATEKSRRALSVAEKLAADHPDRPHYRSLQAVTLGRLTEQLIRVRQFDEADKTLARWREIAEGLVRDYPDVPRYRTSLAFGSQQSGSILAQRGRSREAREALDRGYEIMARLAQDHPDVPVYRQDLAGICYFAAVDYATLDGADHRDGARARELARRAVEIEPDNSAYWKALALAEYRAGDFDAAVKAETKRFELRKNDGYAYDWLIMALSHLGRGDRAQARNWAGRLLRGVEPGAWSSADADFVRLARENEERLRELVSSGAAQPGGPPRRE